MDAIKGMLREELENSLKMKERYEEELKRLPIGALIKKKIRGHDYFYLVFREGKKVRMSYKGSLSEEEIRKYEQVKAARARYRQLLARANKQIKYIKGILRDKNPA
jgi:hypothetical protein